MSSQYSERSLDSPVDAIAPAEDGLEVQIGALNDQAERCRRLAKASFNRELNAMLGTMADGFERTAKELSKKRCSSTLQAELDGPMGGSDDQASGQQRPRP